MSVILLCTCSGDQSNNGSSSKMTSRETTPDDSQVNEVESDLRETLSLNYEEARALLGRLEHQRGNFDAALQRHHALQEGYPHVYGMSMHMSLHSVSLLLEAILLKAKSFLNEQHLTNAAEECRTIIDIIESAWPYGVPDGTAEECKLIDIFRLALEYLPKLWMRSGCFDETIIANRKALAKPWNLDSQRSANLQKDLAVTLLYCGVEVKFPQNLLLLKKWDPELVNHLIASGMDDSALNIIRNSVCVLERKGKPHIPSLLLGAKLCCKNPKHASEGIKFANKVMKSFRSCDMHFISVVNHFLGICYGPFSRSSTSDLDQSRLQDDELRLLQHAAAMAKYNPKILYSLAWENAMQRKLNASVQSATKCLEMVMGGSISAWKLLILILSAQQNLQEAEATADFATDEAEKDGQLDIFSASRGQSKSSVESFRVFLSTIQAKKEVWKSTTC
ncbi:hypothetical protein PVAP13_9NG592400 [Panicum virgatum]|uniref:Uncharacterized protein n=1 Tax=Panicum virgatum TaxID=38727 RepID=A0A8T0MW07_PANVG|nr:hypothetical protein PVAP13_9NG592400 [Panicum virgatum]